MNRLGKIQFSTQLSKVKQLSDTISGAVFSKEYLPGDPLPSINQISQHYEISRDTVFKAFIDLKKRGIVDSTPTKGYYVTNSQTNILLLVDIYSPYKTELYKALVDNIPSDCKVDLYFHNNDEQRFNKLINDSVDRYSYYLIMNCYNDKYCKIIDKLPPKKVMLLDFGKFGKSNFAYACQDFDSYLYNCLHSGLALFKKYKEIVMVMPHDSEHPKSSIEFFNLFCKENNFKSTLTDQIKLGKIKRGKAYLIVNHNQMIEFIKDCRFLNLELGKDVGLVVFNDEPVFEILDCGITVISTNFKKMGELAAEFIKTRELIQTYVETKMIVRRSL